MVYGILGILIGLAVFGAGIYYWKKEKHDAESKRIYSITAAVGAGVLILGIVFLILSLR